MLAQSNQAEVAWDTLAKTEIQQYKLSVKLGATAAAKPPGSHGGYEPAPPDEINDTHDGGQPASTSGPSVDPTSQLLEEIKKMKNEKSRLQG